jgi:hypothetical protein
MRHNMPHLKMKCQGKAIFHGFPWQTVRLPMVIWLVLVNLAAGTAESGLEGLGRRGVPCQDADSNCWEPPSINRFKVELIHPGLTLWPYDPYGSVGQEV